MPGTPTKTFAVAVAIACALTTAANAAITISTHKTQDENCTAGVCTPTGPNPNIQVKDLEKLLAHSDVKIVTGQGSTGIDVLDPLTWASHHRLTLDANQSIHVRAPVVVEGTGGVTLITNDGGTGGDYEFDAPGALAFWDTTSSLIINGQSFTLVKNIATMASDIAADSSSNYAFSASYDASADGVYSSAPVGGWLVGTFEGLGNTIKNLTIASTNSRSFVGLFAASGGVIRDINLSAVSISGAKSPRNGEEIGALAGRNTGTIHAAHVDGHLSGGQQAQLGGLVGGSSGTIEYSSFSGTCSPNVYGHPAVMGGLVGLLDGGSITHSFAIVQLHGGNLVGGLVAFNSAGSIALSYARGEVRGSNFGGGLEGYSFGATTTQSFANTNVSASRAGGLVAYQGSDDHVSQSYSTGAVKSGQRSHSYTGGFAAETHGHVSQSYATGATSGAWESTGGFVGDGASGHFATTYWDITTTQQAYGDGGSQNIPGITGLTDAQLKSALPAGFHPNVWGQDPNINNGWPYLLANPPQ